MTVEDRRRKIDHDLFAYFYEWSKQKGPNKGEELAREAINIMSTLFGNFSELTVGTTGEVYWSDMKKEFESVLAKFT